MHLLMIIEYIQCDRTMMQTMNQRNHNICKFNVSGATVCCVLKFYFASSQSNMQMNRVCMCQVDNVEKESVEIEIKRSEWFIE